MNKFGIKFEEKQGKYYSQILEKNILSAVKRLYKGKSRFITATAFQNPGPTFYIFYHFEAGKKILTLRTVLKDNKAESISSIYPTAEWIEREMAELYGIQFSYQASGTSHQKTQKPLFLTPDIKTPFVESKN